MQPSIRNSLNTLKIELWTEAKAAQCTSQRDNNSLILTFATCNTIESQSLTFLNCGNCRLNLLNELNVALLYLHAILIDVEVTCLSVRNIVLIRSSSCVRASSTSWTLRTLRTLRTLSTSIALVALVAFITLVTFVTLSAKSIIICLNSVLYPVAIFTDGPNCTRSTVSTLLTIVNSESLAVTKLYSYTACSLVYACDNTTCLNQLTDFLNS